MALIGEQLDDNDEICGAVVSLRAKIDRIQLWLRSKDDVERINSMGKKLVKLLDLGNEAGIGLEFQVSTHTFKRCCIASPYLPRLNTVQL